MELAINILNAEIQKRESSMAIDGIGLANQIQLSKQIVDLTKAVKKLSKV